MLGRILLILLLTVAVEFGASTFLYERAERFSVREDEAHRLAEHLVIARNLIAERRPADRPAAARELVTDRYDVRWSPTPPRISTFDPELESMQRQVVAWEPSLADAHLRLHLSSLPHGSVVAGNFRLADGSWVLFQTREISRGWSLAIGRVLLGLLPAAVVLALSAVMVRVTLRPLRGLIRATTRVGKGELEPVAEDGPAEIRSLIHAFNQMQHRIHDLIESRTQALAAVGHDLRTPLARLQLRLDSAGDAEARRAMAGDLGEMNDMISSLLAFLSGDDDPEPPVAADVAAMLMTQVDAAQDQGRDIHYEGPDHLDRLVRPSLLRRAFANLIDNALHYGERVRVTLAAGDTGVDVTVDDDGPGIPPDRIEDVLRPFVRLDKARTRNTKGLGLGLSIVARAVATEGGTLSLVNRPEGGLSARIHLPTL